MVTAIKLSSRVGFLRQFRGLDAPLKRNQALETTRRALADDAFKTRHRTTAKAFTRVRQLPFALVITLVLRKSMKSLQNVVNEAMTWLDVEPVTGSAFSQARYKFKHGAFIELNAAAVVNTVYGDGDYRTFWGLRILAVDGSKILLPASEFNGIHRCGSSALVAGRDAGTSTRRSHTPSRQNG
jgi:hypothetical protein